MEGEYYENRIVLGDSLAEGPLYNTITIDKYHPYHISNVDEAQLAIHIQEKSLQYASYYMQIALKIKRVVRNLNKNIFGTTQDVKDGELMKHMGNMPTMKQDKFELDNDGSGELGRIYTKYYNGMIAETKG